MHVHAFLDGRDTPPKSAAASLAFMDGVCARHRGARIASIVGRYYAMDRDQRWERVRAAYDLLVDGARAVHRADAPPPRSTRPTRAARPTSSSRPTAIAGDGARAMADGDVVVFMNFRADRARELTRALTDAAFAGFPRARVPRLARYVCLTSYGDEFAALPVAFAPQSIGNGFGEYLSRLGLTQLRIAETEKYAHVTYFFSGGVEAPYPGEDRVLVPSPQGRDLRPAAGDERARGDRPPRRRHRQRQVRRDRLQLRQRRHGRPHRQPGRRDARRSRRSTPASGASSTPRARPAARC